MVKNLWDTLYFAANCGHPHGTECINAAPPASIFLQNCYWLECNFEKDSPESFVAFQFQNGVSFFDFLVNQKIKPMNSRSKALQDRWTGQANLFVLLHSTTICTNALNTERQTRLKLSRFLFEFISEVSLRWQFAKLLKMQFAQIISVRCGKELTILRGIVPVCVYCSGCTFIFCVFGSFLENKTLYCEVFKIPFAPFDPILGIFLFVPQ